MPTYRIDLAYDGTDFRGYARNEGVRTVQGVLEDLLLRITRGDAETAVAGRTDAGVHARRNVVSLVTDAEIEPDRLKKAITTTLGPEVIASAVARVPDGFHARFSASSRSYRYFVDDSGTPDPLKRRTVWAVDWPLDVIEMDRAASSFVGEHDFASLCRAHEGRTTERAVTSAGWSRDDGLVVFSVEARAFCHQMVRSMVAVCVDVGRGKIGAESVAPMLEAKDRNAARGAAPPRGLVLWDVGF